MNQPNNPSTRLNKFSDNIKAMAAVIGAVTTLLVAVGGLYKLVVTDNKQENKKPQQETLEKLKVAAESLTGDTYKHPENKPPAELKYQAHGMWTAIPNNVKEDNIPKGERDANGYTDTNFSANSDKPCPNSNTAALVVIGEDGQCLSGGVTGSFEAQPGHEYRFIMNDNRTLYGDNKGTITVSLFRKK